MELNRTGSTRGSLIVTPDGGVVIAHNGVSGLRLIAFSLTVRCAGTDRSTD